eukprot:g29657.t1
MVSNLEVQILSATILNRASEGLQKEPSSVVRGAIVGPSDGVRDRPRKFPHPGPGHEWRRISRALENFSFQSHLRYQQHHLEVSAASKTSCHGVYKSGRRLQYPRVLMIR